MYFVTSLLNDHLSCLAFVALDVLAFRNMTIRCGFAELSSAVRAPDVVGCVHRRRRRKIRQFSSVGHVTLSFFCCTKDRDEFFSFLSPIALLGWRLSLKKQQNKTGLRQVSYFSVWIDIKPIVWDSPVVFTDNQVEVKFVWQISYLLCILLVWVFISKLKS